LQIVEDRLYEIRIDLIATDGNAPIAPGHWTIDNFLSSGNFSCCNCKIALVFRRQRNPSHTLLRKWNLL